MRSSLAFIALMLAAPPLTANASPFWDAVKHPELRVYRAAVAQANEALASRNFSAADAAATRAIEARPEVSRGYVLRALSRLQPTQLDLARRDVERALELDPAAFDNPAEADTMSRAMAHGRFFPLAGQLIERAARQLGDSARRRELYRRLGDCRMAEGPQQLDQAIAAYRVARRGAGVPMLDLAFALALRRAGTTEPATFMERTLAGANPNILVPAENTLPDSELRFRRALLLSLSDRFDDAITELRAISEGPYLSTIPAEITRIEEAKREHARAQRLANRRGARRGRGRAGNP